MGTRIRRAEENGPVWFGEIEIWKDENEFRQRIEREHGDTEVSLRIRQFLSDLIVELNQRREEPVKKPAPY